MTEASEAGSGQIVPWIDRGSRTFQMTIDGDGPDTGIRWAELRKLIELGCWTALILSPFLYWVNGPAVSPDQFIIRMVLVALAAIGGPAQRLVACSNRRHPRGISLSLSWLRRPGSILVPLLLCVHAALLFWIDVRNSPSPAEVAHLPAGLSHWHLGTFALYNVNPPLPRLVAALPLIFLSPKTNWHEADSRPLARSEFAVGRHFVENNGPRIFWYFTIARWACIPFSLLGAMSCYCWALKLYGLRAGVLALTLWVFSPNILGNGAMVTPDIAAAATGVAAGYLFWRWLGDPTWSCAICAGLGLGLAELTKTTWIVLFLMWPALWVFWRVTATLRRTPELGDTNSANIPSCWHLVTILVLAVYVLNLGYGFEGSFKPLGQYEFVSGILSGQDDDSIGNRFSDSLIGSLAVPLPTHYLRGMDVQYHDFEQGKWSYLCGHQKMGGWWYWYIVAFAVKAPLGTWCLLGLACATALCVRNRRRAWRDEVVLMAPGIAVLVLVSAETGFSRYLRYALPALPFVFVWISQIGQLLRSRGARLVAIVAITWSIESSLFIYPHSLSYFNEAAGGPLNGPSYLLDANIDWGQDLLFLNRWCAIHPVARAPYVRIFGFVSPHIAGIEGRNIPVLADINEDPYDHHAPALEPGYYAISVNHLYGYKHFGDENDSFAYLRQFAPIDRAGYSIYMYDLNERDIETVRAEVRAGRK